MVVWYPFLAAIENFHIYLSCVVYMKHDISLVVCHTSVENIRLNVVQLHEEIML